MHDVTLSSMLNHSLVPSSPVYAHSLSLVISSSSINNISSSFFPRTPLSSFSLIPERTTEEEQLLLILRKPLDGPFIIPLLCVMVLSAVRGQIHVLKDKGTQLCKLALKSQLFCNCYQYPQGLWVLSLATYSLLKNESLTRKEFTISLVVIKTVSRLESKGQKTLTT